eukprot:10604760-Lingulodinium_polyedra.AAC.1
MARALSPREGGRNPCRGPSCAIQAARRSSSCSCSATRSGSFSPAWRAPSPVRLVPPLSRVQASR